MSVPPRGSENLYYPVLGIITGLSLLLVAEIPSLDNTLRTYLIDGTATAFLIFLALCRPFAEKMNLALRHGLNIFILLLLLWSSVAFFLAPFRGYAATEMLRVLSSAAVYFLCAYALPRDKQGYALVAGFIGIGIVTALTDFLQFSQIQGGGLGVVGSSYGVLGTHEIVGSLLVLMLPLAVSLAISDSVDARPRIAAQAATLILGTALLLARTRTAWLATVLALFVLGILFLRYMKPDKSEKSPRPRRGRGRFITASVHWMSSPITLLAVGFALLIGFGGIAPLLSSRLKMATVLEDVSLADRVHRWEANARMAGEKPLTGWGLGASVVTGGRWTHEGDETVEAIANGVGHNNLAHNYYVQWAADTGIIGLTLYMAVMVAFLLTMIRALPGMGNPVRRIIVIGCTATVAASLLDAFASPAYHFHGISALLWANMGIGVAALRGSDRHRERTPALSSTPITTWVISPLIGLIASAALLGVAKQREQMGKTQPYGALTVVPVRLDSRGQQTIITEPVPPDTTVTWVAHYKDGGGNELATMPGTHWFLLADPAVLPRTAVQFVQITLPGTSSLRAAGLQIQAHATKQPFEVSATYWDDYGRRYDASARVKVQSP